MTTLAKKQETFAEFVIRLLAKIGTLLAISMCGIMLWAVVGGDQQIANTEKEYGVSEVYESSTYVERIPFKVQMQRYINSLPVPEKTQMLEESEPIEAETQMTIPEVEIVIETAIQQESSLESDVMLLAQIMHLEEGITRMYVSYEEAKMAHLLCGSVIIHRKNMNYMGAQTIRDVIFEPGQYASIGKLYQEEIPEETIQWARELIENGPIGPEDMIYQSQVEQGAGTYAHIYNQYFCCITNPNLVEETIIQESVDLTEGEIIEMAMENANVQ